MDGELFGSDTINENLFGADQMYTGELVPEPVDIGEVSISVDTESDNGLYLDPVGADGYSETGQYDGLDLYSETPLGSVSSAINPETGLSEYDILEENEIVSMDAQPVVIDDLVIDDNKSTDTYDDRNVLKSLATIRENIKLSTAQETDYNSEVVAYLESINNYVIYTNYLIAVLVGILIIKTIFEKVMP